MAINQLANALKEGMEAARIIEENEPEYIYKKGEGWVVRRPCEELSWTQGGYRITLYNRPPLPGERFYYQYEGQTLESTKRALEHQRVNEESGNPAEVLEQGGILAGVPKNRAGFWVTIKVERV
jgi:hypothetical protein